MKKKLFKTVTYDNIDEFKIHSNFNCKEDDIIYNSEFMYFDFWTMGGITIERHQYNFKEGEDCNYFLKNH